MTIISFPISEEENIIIEQMAQKRNVSKSEFIKELLSGNLKKDEEEIQRLKNQKILSFAGALKNKDDGKSYEEMRVEAMRARFKL